MEDNYVPCNPPPPPFPSSSSSKPDRKTVEKNRRNQMKKLFNQLIALVPHPEGTASSSREGMSLPEQVEEATKYIKRLQIQLERLKERKSKLIEFKNRGSAMQTCQNLLPRDPLRYPIANALRSTTVESTPECGVESPPPPQIEVHVSGGTALQVMMTTGLECQSSSIFTEAIRALHEEGAEVVNATYTTMPHSIFHTIHAQVEESPGSQVRIARIIERLNRFCFDP